MDYNFLLKSSGGLANGDIILHRSVSERSSTQKAMITSNFNNPLPSGNPIKGKQWNYVKVNIIAKSEFYI